MLPHAACLHPSTDGCTWFLSATLHHPLDLLREAAWANVFFLHCAQVSENICGNGRLLHHTHVLKETWKLCREMIRGSLHTTLETKCLVLSLTLQSCLCHSQRLCCFVWKAWLNLKKTELGLVYTRFKTVNDWIYHLSNIEFLEVSRFHLCKCDQFEHLKLQINKLSLVLWIIMFSP